MNVTETVYSAFSTVITVEGVALYESREVTNFAAQAIGLSPSFGDSCEWVGPDSARVTLWRN